MRKLTLIDTGPLVAFLSRRDSFHEWAKDQFVATPAPLLTCEAVLTEACFLLGKVPGGCERVFDLLARKVVKTGFRLGTEIEAVSQLMKRYRNVPMSLADACLVRMAETNPGSVLLTLDRDFRVYRMHRRKVVPVRMPSEI